MPAPLERTHLTRVLLLEPYDTGSHAEWARTYQRASRLDITLLTMPGRFWKWRMHGAAVTMSRRLAEIATCPDVVLATDMLDLAAFLGLSRDRLAHVPVALYMHENQLAYPEPIPEEGWTPSRRRRAARRDERYPFINVTSMLAADLVLWNSAYNRTTFLTELPRFLGRFPDERVTAATETIAARSRVLPLGMDLQALGDRRPAGLENGPPIVVWNHRWEHDKDPERFFEALEAVAERGIDFRVVVLGESFGAVPPVFERARARLGSRVVQWGYVGDRASYATWLWASDVVVSTARHEFFGAAVAEAVYCRCLPVLPNALAYPELIPEQYRAAVLYDDFDGLVDRLARTLRYPDCAMADALAAHISRFDWHQMASRYDESMQRLTRSNGPAADRCRLPSAPSRDRQPQS